MRLRRKFSLLLAAGLLTAGLAFGQAANGTVIGAGGNPCDPSTQSCGGIYDPSVVACQPFLGPGDFYVYSLYGVTSFGSWAWDMLVYLMDYFGIE